MRRLCSLLLSLQCLAAVASAYRIGDAVGVLLRTQTPSRGSASLEAYRHQLPRFGVSTKTRFETSDLLNADSDAIRMSGQSSPRQKSSAPGGEDEHLRLSLSFDEGFHHIPWLDVYSKPRRGGERALESLIVTIVYSNGDGTIHAVHREARYRDPSRGGGGGMPKSFTVEYVWVNEADVDLEGGLLTMLAAVLIVSLCGMIGACTSTGDDGDVPGGKRYKDKRSSSSLGSGASEGFAKRL